MSSINFTPGAVIPSTWLNSVNAFTQDTSFVWDSTNKRLSVGGANGWSSGNWSVNASFAFLQTNALTQGVAGNYGLIQSATLTALNAPTGGSVNLRINNVDKAAVDTTGLTITGGLSVSQSVIATTSVVTPFVSSPVATDLLLGVPAGAQWAITVADGRLRPVNDNLINLGASTFRIASVFTPIIDSGTTGPLSLKTNNGSEQLRIAHLGGTIANFYQFNGNVTTGSPQMICAGTDTNIAMAFSSKGIGAIQFYTSSFTHEQLRLLDNAGVNVLTIANGTNPTINVTAGNLAITPSTLFGGSISLSTNPAQTGLVRVPFGSGSGLWSRNSANAADITLIEAAPQNSVNDIVKIGTTNSTGVLLFARSGAGVPTTSDIPASTWCLWRDTSGATTKVYYNNAGTLQSTEIASPSLTYQEGTWTPSVGGTATYTTQTGTFTKVGRKVYVRAKIVINTIGSGSTITISGLPFASAVENVLAATFQNSATSIVSLVGSTNIAASTISLLSKTAAATSDSSNAIFGNAASVIISGSYEV